MHSAQWLGPVSDSDEFCRAPLTISSAPEAAIGPPAALLDVPELPVIGMPKQNPDIVMVLTGGGSISVYSNSVAHVLGYAPEQVLGRSLLELLHPDNAREALEAFRAGVQRGPDGATLEWRLRHADGGWRIVEGVLYPLLAGAQTPTFVLSCRDVTAARGVEEIRERLTQVLEATSDYVLTSDLHGRVLYMNRALLRLLGSPPAEHLAELNLVDLHPQWAAETLLCQAIPGALNEGSWRGESALIRHDGREIPVSQVTLAHRSTGSAGRFISIVSRDISEEKAAEQRIELERKYFVELFDGLPEAVAIIDAEQRVTRINKEFTRTFGYSEEEAIGRRVDDLIVPEELRGEGATLWAAVVAGEAVNVEAIRRDRTGRRIDVSILGHPISASGEPGAAYVIYRNITGRRRAEERVRFQAHLLDAVGDAVIATDSTGRILYWNEFAERITGSSAPEAIGRSLRAVVGFDSPRRQIREIARWLQTGKRWSGELAIRGRDGSSLPVLATTAPIRDENGRIVGMVGVCSDLSERKQLEEQLRLSQKMEAVGRLAGGVAHDFNNLLTVIGGHADLLLDQLSEEHGLREGLQDIRDASGRAAALTRQLLAFSRRQVLQPVVLDLNPLITDFTKMIRRVISEGISIRTSLAASLGRVKADPNQLEQVLLNLFVNAQDAMPDGGAIRVETAETRLTATDIRDRALEVEPGEYVSMLVADSGVGMDAAVQARMFEPFFTTKEPGKGTGLGLATVYGIVKQSGGAITVDSEPGRGTSFRVYLPAVAEPIRSKPGLPLERLVPGSETVLLVEDEESVRTLVARVLRRSGYSVLEGRDGNEAIRIARDFRSRIDLLLTDVVMPAMSGPQLAKALAGERPEMAILFVSGHADSEIVEQGYLSAGTEFLQKPFSFDALLRKVRDVLDGNAVAVDASGAPEQSAATSDVREE